MNVAQNITANAATAVTAPFPYRIGYIFKTTNPLVQIVINVPRSTDTTTRYLTGTALTTTLDTTVQSTISVTQYSLVYNPATDCCVTSCPPNSGINLGVIVPTVPSCVACTSGLVYNSLTAQCQCQTGFYSVVQASTNQTQCFPCLAQLCQTCAQATNTVCSSCVTGAAVINNVCTCLSGYYQNASLCNACPYQCGICTTVSVCTTCSDNTTRNINNSCACNIGLFDAGVAVCGTCPSLCRTCSSATNCTSCFT